MKDQKMARLLEIIEEQEAWEKKMAIIAEMVENGYHLMNRTAEQMADMFTVEQLESSKENFLRWKAGQK